MSDRFSERDHLAWSRFMLCSVLLAGIARAGDRDRFITELREQLSPAWVGLGAQGVEGAMLSMTLTLEAIGADIVSTQTSPENSEIVVRSLPGERLLAGLEDRFDIRMHRDEWFRMFGGDVEAADLIYDILGAIADGADVEYLRERTDEGDIRLVVRAW